MNRSVTINNAIQPGIAPAIFRISVPRHVQSPPGYRRRLTGSLIGGNLAGRIMSLLIGNKPARKFVKNISRYGGATILGRLANKAFKTWQYSIYRTASLRAGIRQKLLYDQYATAQSPSTLAFELKQIKAMVAATSIEADGNEEEQKRIVLAMSHTNISSDMKQLLFELMTQPISVEDIASDVEDITQRSKLYLTSCLMTDLNKPLSQQYLQQLASALHLPEALSNEIQSQARITIEEEHK